MRNTVKIVGIEIDKLDFLEAQEKVAGFLEGDSLNMIFTPNSEILLDAVKDRELENILNDAQLVIPDGIGVVIASKFYGTPLKERVTGVDLATKILELGAQKNCKLFLLGASQESVTLAAEKIQEEFKGINIVGIRNGYYLEDEEEQIIDEISESGAEILFVGLGAPRQEKLIYKYKDKLGVKIALGFGGGIDTLSGTVKRAPEFYQKAGLEWLYRLIKQPSRFKRVLKLPKFVLLAMVDAATSKY
ncbi:MAG: tagA [Clostridia bacterium]|jgi:N-acetylglucosaminyldiphosphoundecaprenol N-acetyl-beta-D-mannosaminyltransferase|nr:tagA [Clostridia bacterium]